MSITLLGGVIAVVLVFSFSKTICNECGFKIKNKSLTRCPECGYMLMNKGD